METKRLLSCCCCFCCCLIYLKTVKDTIRQIYSHEDLELLIKTILKLMKNFRTLHDLSPNFMKEMFYCFPNLSHRKNNLYVHTRNTIE